MADAIVTAVASQIGLLLSQEAQNLYAVKDKIERLKDELVMMHAFLRDKTTKNHEDDGHSEVIRTAISKIRDLAYEAEDIVEKYSQEVTHKRPEEEGVSTTLKWSCGLLCRPRDVVANHQVGSDIDELTAKLSQLKSQLQLYAVTGSGVRSCSPSSSSSAVDQRQGRRRRTVFLHMLEDDPVGLEQVTQLLVDKLVRTNTKVISISGMGGLGKSTLAKKVYKHEDVRQNFKYFVWVYVSQQFQTINIWRKVFLDIYRENEAKAAGISNLNVEELLENINKALKEKKCLVVLDDLWTVDDWARLQPAFWYIQKSSSRLLITTRNQELLKFVDPTGFLHQLKCLGEKHSWELFQNRIRAVLGEIKLDPQMESLGRKMVSNLKGLPLAIVALSGMLTRKVTNNEWEDMSRNLDVFLNHGNNHGQIGWTVSQVLELSYIDLPYYLKSCFLYLASFPEDFEIPVYKLGHLWEVEGLLHLPSSVHKDSMEDVVRSYIDELAERSLIQVGQTTMSKKIKTFHLHDMMRDMCIRKAIEENFLHVVTLGGSHEVIDHKLINSDLDMEHKRLHRLVMHHFVDKDKEFASLRKIQKWMHLRSLMVFMWESVQYRHLNSCLKNADWKAFLLLRVLDLECASLGKSLPNEIGDLIYLKYLSLKDTYVEEVPSSIGKLRRLITLDLRVGAEIFVCLSIPNELWKMERLKHLHLPNVFICKDASILELRSLTHLETLINFNLRQCRIQDLQGMTELKRLSYNIYDLGILSTTTNLKLLLNYPNISANSLKKPFLFCIEGKILNEDPIILQLLSTSGCHDFSFLQLLFDGIMPVTVDLEYIFHPTLTCLVLHGSKLKKDPMPILENHPQLRCLCLDTCLDKEVKMLACSKGGFPRLTTLVLHALKDVEEWKVEEGSMPSLIRLSMDVCYYLERKGIPSELYASSRVVQITTRHFVYYMKVICNSMAFRRWVTK